jgi:hypothetical protein
LQVVQQLASGEYPDEFAAAAFELVLGVEIDAAEDAGEWNGDVDRLPVMQPSVGIEAELSLLGLVLFFDRPLACVLQEPLDLSSLKAPLVLALPRRFLASFAATTDAVRDLNLSTRAIAAATSAAVYVSRFDGFDLFIGPVRYFEFVAKARPRPRLTVFEPRVGSRER